MPRSKRSPQLEDGFSRIANELLDALRQTDLSPTESKVIWETIRYTYGWQQKTVALSFSQIADDCRMDRRVAVRTVVKLIDRRILVRVDGNLGLNKHYGTWLPSPIKVVTPQSLPDAQPTLNNPSDSAVTTQLASDSPVTSQLTRDKELVTPQSLPDAQPTLNNPSDSAVTSQLTRVTDLSSRLVTAQSLPLVTAQSLPHAQKKWVSPSSPLVLPLLSPSRKLKENTKDIYTISGNKELTTYTLGKPQNRRKHHKHVNMEVQVENNGNHNGYPKWLGIIDSIVPIKKDGIEDYVASIETTFATVNLEVEAMAFKLWWTGGKKTLKNPKLAWFNWLKNSIKFREQRDLRDKAEAMVGQEPTGALARVAARIEKERKESGDGTIQG